MQLKFSHVDIVVHDLEEAVAYYRRVFGCTASPKRVWNRDGFHVEYKIMFSGTERFFLVQPISGNLKTLIDEKGEGTIYRLCYTVPDDAGLWKMQVRPGRGDGADRIRDDLAVLRDGWQQFRSVGEEFRRPALVGLYMRDIRADHAVIRLAQRSQRQRIGRRAVKGEEHFAIDLEKSAKGVRRLGRPGIVAIGRLVALVCLDRRRPCFRTDPGVVVAGEMLRGTGHKGGTLRH